MRKDMEISDSQARTYGIKQLDLKQTRAENSLTVNKGKDRYHLYFSVKNITLSTLLILAVGGTRVIRTS